MAANPTPDPGCDRRGSAGTDDVLIIGAGIGGLTLALALAQRGIPARIYEAAAALEPIGAGLNLLPHAVAVLAELDLFEALAKAAVITQESIFFNRFGQLIYREAAGRHAGYPWPQLSMHRGDTQLVLLDAVRQRLGWERVYFGWRCTGATERAGRMVAEFTADSGANLPPQTGSILIAADGIHSAIRRQLYPTESEPIYSGVNMWRGLTRQPPFLTGASMVRAGWLSTGKMVIYPVRNHADGSQLINWVAERETPNYQRWDWTRPGRVDDFIGAFADWQFDWLDVPAMIRNADSILEFPMVDRDPLPRWSFERITLMGDAAHPMLPRGSNGAVQAILDARDLAHRLATSSDWVRALEAYDQHRRAATTAVVLTNRSQPPDAILREIHIRTGDRPFRHIDDVISAAELAEIANSYKTISGYGRGGAGSGAAAPA
ncbi:MAG TPA: flavin-dependent oxidoreductase [Hyphomicrobiaceae bacterium]|nr:flavin-dependent oxidoreductase [Hyphomicrobiaceae bacterium]